MFQIWTKGSGFSIKERRHRHCYKIGDYAHIALREYFCTVSLFYRGEET
jgi:hypothetical protein